MPALEVDHVLIATPDLAAGARLIAEAFGLASVDGGRHPGWGTANRIVALGDCYLELVAVVDTGVAATNAFGRWVGSASTTRPLGWAVRTTNLDDVAGRLGMAVAAGSRKTPTGDELRWRTAGLERAADEPSLPFFIEWAKATRLPGRTAAPTGRPAGVVRLELTGDRDRLNTWLGHADLPIDVRAGPPWIEAVVLRRGDDELRLAEIAAS